MNIKLANKKQLAEVSQMYRDMLITFYPHRKISDKETFKRVLLGWIYSSFHYVFIAEDKGRIIGLLILNIDDNCELTSPCLNVTGTYIKQNYRKSNAIKILMAKALNMANSLKMNLHTSATPQSASLSLKVGGEVQSVQIERVYNG